MMINKLTLKQLQFLDIFLNKLSFIPNFNKTPKIVFKDGNQLISGNFFSKSEAMEYPCTKKAYCISYYKHVPLQVISSIETLFTKHLDGAYHAYPKSAELHLENLETFLFDALTEDFFADIPECLEEVPPYIYNPTFYDLENFKPSFYILDPKKTYEVVSIILEPSQN